ncbi:MAG: 4Fe-4S dicluster domain-containing protein, partial [Pirellulaceae bacterium]
MPDDSLTREIMGNIGTVSRCLFYLLAACSISCFLYGLHRRTRLWRLGRQTGQRLNWRKAAGRFITHVMTQRTLRRSRRAAGIAHRLFFYGFIVLLIGTILIAIEHYGAFLLGREADQPLFHKGLYFACYEFILDAFGIAMLLGCCWFIRRRWLGRSSMAHHWSDWVVLITLLLLGISGYLVEGLRIIHAQTPQAGYSFVGFAVAALLQALGTTSPQASLIHLTLWWLHSLLALGLIAAFPYTRLLHSLAGEWLISTRQQSLGVMTPIAIEEVEATGRVGVERIEDFTRQQLTELDACVSCGRCQDACPAHEAGKPLSPRDVVQDLRSHLNIIGPLLLAGIEESDREQHPKLHEETISAETLWSCTSCHACVDVCPLDVDPLKMITDMRRHLVGEGHLRGSPATALQKMQRSGNPWGLPADERLHWAEGLEVPTVHENQDFDVLYWVGCAASYDRRIQRVARAVVQLLHHAQVNFAVLGPEERCTGESARRMGDEFLFQELAASNLATLQQH